MVQLGLFIKNKRGAKAFVGDKVKLNLLVQGWMSKEQAYQITEIKPEGTIQFNYSICQHISGIEDFSIAR